MSGLSDRSLAAHIGTPGLGMYCAAGWALEGFCDVSDSILTDIHSELTNIVY